MSEGRPNNDASFTNVTVKKRATATQRLTTKRVEAGVVVADDIQTALFTADDVQVGDVTADSVNTNGFALPTGATTDYVLTSDASGNGTWQEAPASSPVTLSESLTISAGGSSIVSQNGYVTLNGNVVTVNVYASFNADGTVPGGTTLATLPAAYRPTTIRSDALQVSSFGNGASASDRFDISGASVNTDGTIELSATLGSNTNLDGFSVTGSFLITV